MEFLKTSNWIALLLLVLAFPLLASAQSNPTLVRVALLYAPSTGTYLPSSEFGKTESGGSALKPPPQDAWLSMDKAQHVVISFLWTLGTQYTLVNKVNLSEQQALPWSIGSSALAGLTKEAFDAQRRPNGLFSYRDLVANALGISLAVVLILL